MGAAGVLVEYCQAGVKMSYTSGRSISSFYDLIAGRWEMHWQKGGNGEQDCDLYSCMHAFSALL